MFAFEVEFEFECLSFTCLKSDDLSIITIDIFGAKNVDSDDG